MKRIIFTLMAFVSLSASAQYILGDKDASVPVTPGQVNAPGAMCLNCGPTSMFSNPVSLEIGGGLSDDLTCYTSYDNFYGLTEPIGKIIFWGYDIFPSGGNYYACTPPAEKDVEIGFYYDDNGSVGSAISRVQATPVKSECVGSYAFGGATLYRYEVELGVPVDLQEGWVSVRAILGQGGCWFAWCLAETGDQFCWQDCYSSFSGYNLDFAFCLLPAEEGGDDNEGTALPLSNWALLIGIVLMAFLTILRWRKIL
jgi:hypothetical protein